MKKYLKKSYFSIFVVMILVIALSSFIGCNDSPKTRKIVFYSEGRVYKELVVPIGTLEMPQNRPQRKDYIFEGWYFDKNFKTPYDINSADNSDENINVYAKWRKEFKIESKKLEIIRDSDTASTAEAKMIASFTFILYNENDRQEDDTIEVWYSEKNSFEDEFVMVACNANNTTTSENYPKFKQTYNIATEFSFLAEKLYCEVRYIPPYNLNKYYFYMGKSHEAFGNKDMDAYKTYLLEAEKCYIKRATTLEIV